MTSQVSKVVSDEQGWDIQVLTGDGRGRGADSQEGRSSWSTWTQEGEWKQLPPQRLWVPRWGVLRTSFSFLTCLRVGFELLTCLFRKYVLI